MIERSNPEDRLLSTAERELVEQTQPPGIDERSRDELQAIGQRLRAARDRARRIARQQQREIRGKADPRGATPARDNTGSVAKTDVLVEALKRVTQALRRLNAPSRLEVAQKALAMKRAAQVAHHPSSGWSPSSGMKSKASKKPTVQADPREVGRVSKAVKSAQARRDSRGRG